MFRKQWDKEMYPELVNSAFFYIYARRRVFGEGGEYPEITKSINCNYYRFFSGSDFY